MSFKPCQILSCYELLHCWRFYYILFTSRLEIPDPSSSIIAPALPTIDFINKVIPQVLELSCCTFFHDGGLLNKVNLIISL